MVNTNVAEAVKDMREGSGDIEIVMDPVTGEMKAVPKAQADQMDVPRVGTMARQTFYKL